MEGTWLGRLVIVGLCLIAGPVFAAPAGLPDQYAQSPDGDAMTEKEQAALDGGKILVHLKDMPGTAIKKARAIALFDAAPEEVFAVLTDVEEFPNFMPYCKKAELQRQEDGWSWVSFRLHFLWPIGDRYYVLRLARQREVVDERPVLISRWEHVPNSGNIEDTYGSWEILAYDKGRSFVRYTVFADPGGRLPAWARNMATNIVVPKVIKGLRKRLAERARAAAAPDPPK